MRGKHFKIKNKKIKNKKVNNSNTCETITINNSNNSNINDDKSKNPKHFRRKCLSIFRILLLLIFIPTLLISGYKICEWYSEKQSFLKEEDKITSLVNFNLQTSDFKDAVGSVDEKKNSPYWKYMEMDLMDVDFKDLLKENSDTVAWIKVNGTNINYPVVQAKDNNYYLKRSFYKKNNNAGWIFLDYRNNSLNNKNTIIYGHNREDDIIFGTLDNILTKKWQNNTDNHIVHVSTEKANTMWQVFSIYDIETTSDYIQTDFSSDKEYKDFLDLISNRSIHNFDTTISEKDKVLTLSTCLNQTDGRIVLHAKLIKYSEKK